MNFRTAALAIAIVSLLSTVAGCASSEPVAASSVHPVVAFAVPARTTTTAERPARFETAPQIPAHIDPAGVMRR
jgi:hypothetical protein